MVSASQQPTSVEPEEPASGSAETSEPTVEQDTVADAPEQTTASPVEKREPLLTRTDQRFVLITVVVLIVCMGIHWVRLSGWGTKPVEITRAAKLDHEFSVEINSGTWVEFMQLEGIGEVLARRIVEEREANGPFESVDEVTRVKGIGRKKLDKIRPHLRSDPLEE